MPPPSPLAIATQAVQRLVKEESYYHKDQVSQEGRIAKLEADLAAGSADLDSNAEYMLKQEVRNFSRPFGPPQPEPQTETETQSLTGEQSLHQQRTALEETKKMFEPLRERIVRAVTTLEEQLAMAEGEGTAVEGEVAKAKEALEAGRKVGNLE
jgi:tubulin-specific chaperone A